MTRTRFPAIDEEAIANTRAALHAYSRILGHCLKASRPKRKHWWHARLRPSLTGFTTGLIHADIHFELILDFRNNITWAAGFGQKRTFNYSGGGRSCQDNRSPFPCYVRSPVTPVREQFENAQDVPKEYLAAVELPAIHYATVHRDRI